MKYHNNNDNNFHLSISFDPFPYDDYDRGDGLENQDDALLTKICFKKDTKEEASAADAEVKFFIECRMDEFIRVSIAKRILIYHNDLIKEIHLDLREPSPEDNEDEEVVLYIIGVGNYRSSNKLTFFHGSFRNIPIEIMHHDDTLNSTHNISHLQFNQVSAAKTFNSLPYKINDYKRA
jgi:hypothetical protein